MAATVLEVLRGFHEETEKLEEVGVQLLLQQQELEGDEQQQQQQQQLAPLSLKPKQKSERKRKEILKLQLALADCIQKIQTKAENIIEIYNDKDEARLDETLFLGGKRQQKKGSAAANSSSSSSSNDIWKNFYDRLKEIRDIHKKRQIEQTQDKQMPYQPPTTQEMLQEYLDVNIYI
ncbi:splicing factor 3a protein, putative [Eimeria brunetti]|uniref:Splicing factor 3a protein, putative n=1 Tax=Eimeria brunetti TaxID=51314 RepID=U6LUX7_9EIME|nr:splicing factor 3a protein, putative [Eimeria brunetti]